MSCATCGQNYIEPISVGSLEPIVRITYIGPTVATQTYGYMGHRFLFGNNNYHKVRKLALSVALGLQSIYGADVFEVENAVSNVQP